MENIVLGVSFNPLAVYRSLSTIFSPSHRLRSNVINQTGIFLCYRLDVHLKKICFNRHLLRDVDRITGWPLRFPCSLLSVPCLAHSLTRSLATKDNSHTLSLRAIPDQSHLALFSQTQIHHCWIRPKLKSKPIRCTRKDLKVALHTHTKMLEPLKINRKVSQPCGLLKLPHTETFGKTLKKKLLSCCQRAREKHFTFTD